MVMLYFFWPLLVAWWWLKFLTMQGPDWLDLYYYSDCGFLYDGGCGE